MESEPGGYRVGTWTQGHLTLAPWGPELEVGSRASSRPCWGTAGMQEGRAQAPTPARSRRKIWGPSSPLQRGPACPRGGRCLSVLRPELTPQPWGTRAQGLPITRCPAPRTSHLCPPIPTFRGSQLQSGHHSLAEGPPTGRSRPLQDTGLLLSQACSGLPLSPWEALSACDSQPPGSTGVCLRARGGGTCV